MNEQISRRGLFKRVASFGAAGLGALVANGCVSYYQPQPVYVQRPQNPSGLPDGIFFCSGYIARNPAEGLSIYDIQDFGKASFKSFERMGVFGSVPNNMRGIMKIVLYDETRGGLKIAESAEAEANPGRPNLVYFAMTISPSVPERTTLSAKLYLNGQEISRGTVLINSSTVRR